jgi:Asparagine synthase
LVEPSADVLAAERILTPVDIARGWLTGSSSFPDRPPRQPHHHQHNHQVTPLSALEQVVLTALLRPPCIVEFSGGRDSSLILAVAARVATREGLPSPVAFTQHYPGLAEANEDEWQELVISHLGVSDWVRHPGTDDADLLGPMARRSIRKWGLVWPPAAHTRATELELAQGGSLLSGEGGDEVLSPRRLGILRQVVGRHVPLSKASMKQLALALAPRRVRAAHYRPQIEASLGAHWLTPEVRQEFFNELTDAHVDEPIDWRTAVLRHPHHRGIRVGLHTFASMASDMDVMRVDPLLQPEFLGALTGAVGRTGVIGRTSAMRQFFGDLLPDPVLSRTSKAQFNRAFFGRETRAFVAEWNGTGTGIGTDSTLVDAERLRLEWGAESPHAMTSLLVQSCWLASHA